MSVARSFGSTERTSASKTGSRSAPRRSASSIKAPNGDALLPVRAASMITIRSSWRAGADGVELVVLLPGGDDGDAAAGVGNKLGDLFAGESGIDGHVGGADGEGGKVGDHPLPAVLGNQRDAVALLRAPAQKRLGQRANTLVDLVRRDGLPVAELVLPKNGARIGRGSNAAKEIIDRRDGRIHRRRFVMAGC